MQDLVEMARMFKESNGGKLSSTDISILQMNLQRHKKSSAGISVADVNKYVDRVRVEAGADSYESEYESLKGHPPGYLNCAASKMCDADICNGGFDQLFHNGTGSGTVVAIAWLEKIGRPQLAEIVRNALYVETRMGENRVSQIIPADYFANYTPKFKSFRELEKLYYADKHGGYFEEEIVEYIERFPEDFRSSAPCREHSPRA